MATSKRERQKAARREKIERQQRHEKRRKNIRRGVIVAIVAVFVIAGGAFLFSGKSTPSTTTTTTQPATSTTTPVTTTIALPKSEQISQAESNSRAVAYGCPAATSAPANKLTWSAAPAMTINTSATYDAHFDTTAGSFVVQLDAKTAPVTTNNFVFLAEHDFYKCTIFHRVIPGFMIQGGDPTGTGDGGPGYTIADEYPKASTTPYPLYSIAMANTGSPHTGGSQFFIVTGAEGETLSPAYSLFGKVVSGLTAVKIIQDEGNSAASANGSPPLITYRILNVTISEA